MTSTSHDPRIPDCAEIAVAVGESAAANDDVARPQGVVDVTNELTVNAH